MITQQERQSIVNEVVLLLTSRMRPLSKKDKKNIRQRVSQVSTVNKRIDHLVCEVFEVDELGLYGKRRDRTICDARNTAMWMRRKIYGENLTIIGLDFKRDHTTVIHAIKQINNLMDTNDLIVKKINTIKNMLYGN